MDDNTLLGVLRAFTSDENVEYAVVESIGDAGPGTQGDLIVLDSRFYFHISEDCSSG